MLYSLHVMVSYLDVTVTLLGRHGVLTTPTGALLLAPAPVKAMLVG
jgi:hypothetical protein